MCQTPSITASSTVLSRALCALIMVLWAATPAPLRSQAEAPSSTSQTSVMRRHYLDGETISYTMQAVNQGRTSTRRYTAIATAIVASKASAIPVERFHWSSMTYNEHPLALEPASQAFEEDLSLAPGFALAIPDLSKVQPILIGPITDLLTFYADVQTAMRQPGLQRAGDHVFFKHGAPNSWADGTHVLLGQDAIDFDLTLQSLDPTTDTATLIVRHLPPAELKVKLPAAWMNAPVSSAPNNWVEVEKQSDNQFTAEVGKETFEAAIKVSVSSGRILAATLDNPVEVLERDCTDAALTLCSAPTRYQIRRTINITPNLPSATK